MQIIYRKPLPSMPRLALVSIALIMITATVAFHLASPPPAHSASSTIVISEFRTRGPNGGNDEFIELYNFSPSPVNISGWQVKGSNSSGTVSTRATIDSGIILNPGCYYLLTNPNASGGPYSGSVPGNQTFSPGITDDGGIALTMPNGTIVDQVGMSNGSAFREGSPLAPLTTNTNRGYERKPGGAAGNAQDTDNNASDFQINTPSDPQNAASNCLGGATPTNPGGVGAATPSTVSAGSMTLLTVNVTPGANPTSTGITVTGNLAQIGGSASQQFFNDATNGDATAGDNIFSFRATVAAGTSGGAKSLAITIADAQSRTGNTSIMLTVQSLQPQRIHDIQGAGHLSPFAGTAVSNIPGIVTAKGSNGFFMQDALPDSNDATSEGIFVFTSSTPTVNAGDAVTVGGTVMEFRPGNTATNLTITEITSPTVTVQSRGNPLPAATVIGAGGRPPPSTIIEDDSAGDVETSGTFDPSTDGIDFYESLEGMRVQVNNAIAVGPRSAFGEIPIVGDNGANATARTEHGGVVIGQNDFNPERIFIDDLFQATPQVNVGDSFTGPIIGVMDYSFGNFKLLATQALTSVSGGLTQEITTAAGTGEIAIATFNVENLDPGDGAAKFNALAGLIVNNLKSPDIIALEEVQDNNGATDDAVVDASTTYNMLIAAIQTAGGPAYQFRDIPPVDDQDGGEPGGNIRVGFLFRTDRGVSFIDRAGGNATIATTVTAGAGGPELSFSPGRIDPANAAWSNSRKPLTGEFTFNGNKLFIIANHFNSKGGDQPLFGRFQPPERDSEVKRNQQAQVVNDFIDSILAIDANAKVIVLGDLNDFEFSMAINTLKGSVLSNLMETLPQSERYTFIFDGNSQALDHILVSNGLSSFVAGYDVVHVNAEFGQRASDHDPQVVRLKNNQLLGFDMAFDPSTVTVQRGTKSNVTLNIIRMGGFTGNVTVTGPDVKPLKMKVKPPTKSTTGNSLSFKVKVKTGAAPGDYELVFTGRDDAGKEKTASLNLTVLP